MYKVFYPIICTVLTLFICSSCITEDMPSNNPKGNFEALWKIIDEHYCFLDYKHEEYGLDWENIHQSYSKRIDEKMSESQLFEVLAEMLNELRDGHVNLYSKDRISQYRAWYDNYPRNFSDSIQSVYLGKHFNIASGMRYQILESNIGYIYVGSFDGGLGDGNLDEVLQKLAMCNALIVDVRNNGGGNLDIAERLAARFTNEEVLTGYISYKKGKGHNDFSEPNPIYLKPATNRVRWQKKVAVLTNRRSYSATNSFVNMMRHAPKAIIIGDTTGGGSGLPFSSELPNGWSIRFSASPMFDANMQHTEFGIEPDVKVDITSEDYSKSVDTIIETAIKLLSASN